MIFSLIVFDLDGTLVDSRRDLAESANQLLAEHGCGSLSEVELGRMVGDGAATLVTRAFRAEGRQPPAGALERFLEIYNARLLAHTRPYPGIPEALAALAARATLAVLTNKPIGPARQILHGLALGPWFRHDLVVGGDGPLPRKPDPSGLLALLVRAAVTPSDTVLVGDSIIDWKTGRAAGTSVCLVRYGFGFEGAPDGELTDRDLIADSPGELIDLL